VNTPHERLTRTARVLPRDRASAHDVRRTHAQGRAHIATPLLQFHGSDDDCIVPPTDADRRWFDARVLEAVPNSVTSCTSRLPLRSPRASPAGWRSATRASGARHGANVEFHVTDDEVNDLARRITAALEHTGIRALNPPLEFSQDCDRGRRITREGFLDVTQCIWK